MTYTCFFKENYNWIKFYVGHFCDHLTNYMKKLFKITKKTCYVARKSVLFNILKNFDDTIIKNTVFDNKYILLKSKASYLSLNNCILILIID